MEKLVVNLASRTFAYKTLAQRPGRYVSAFSSFLREYMDQFVKTDQCAQHVDDFRSAANNARDLT